MCQFDIAWVGTCKEPGEPYCDKHAQVKCGSCGEQATQECSHTGQFVCGYPLCNDCEHKDGWRHGKKSGLPMKQVVETRQPAVLNPGSSFCDKVCEILDLGSRRVTKIVLIMQVEETVKVQITELVNEKQVTSILELFEVKK